MEKKKIHNVNETGFKIPKGYFNDLEDSILSNIKLKELANTSGFKLPEQYFKTVEDRIIENVLEKETPKVVSIFNKQNLIYGSGIAAAVALFLTLFIFKNNPNWNNLDTETVENYFIEENLGSYEIAALLLDEDIKEEEFIDYHLNEEHIETYLLNHTDVEDLIIEKNY